MSKLSKKDKIDIYNNLKHFRKSSTQLSKEYGVSASNFRYMFNLIDRYGIQILDRSYTNYSVEFKEKAVTRALSGQESLNQISLDLALPS